MYLCFPIFSTYMGLTVKPKLIHELNYVTYFWLDLETSRTNLRILLIGEG